VTPSQSLLSYLATLGLKWSWLATHPFQTVRVLSALSRRRFRHDLQVVLAHGAFDEAFYRTSSPDVVATGLPPLLHFIVRGANENRNPHPLFDTGFYIAQNPDVAAAGINPFAHFLSFGWQEGRDPSPRCSMRAFLDVHPDMAGSSSCPLSSLAVYVTKLERLRCHLFIDASSANAGGERLRAFLGGLREPARLGRVIASVTCLIPDEHCRDLSFEFPTWRFATGSVRAALQSVFDRAAKQREPVLVVLEPLGISVEALGSLAGQLENDPMFGSAHARFSLDGKLLPVLVDDVNVAGGALDVAYRALLPSRYLLPEYVSRCFLVRWELAANLPLNAEGTGTVDILFDWLRRARRLGFRSVVSNRAIALLSSSVAQGTAEVVPAAAAMPPDSQMARSAFARRDLLASERRLAAAQHRPYEVLLDIRSLGGTMHGTAKAILGLCDGLHALRPDWRIDLLAQPEGANRHELIQRYPEWGVRTLLPRHTYAAGIRLSQPWQLSDLADLNHLAAVSAYLMLDSIAWDIVYAASPDLETVWRAAAQQADGLIFISEFSRQRFLARFDLHARVRTTVCHLSVDPADYVLPSLELAKPSASFWLVVGNAFDHKWVDPTVDVLAEHFPGHRIVALGSTGHDGGSIVRLPSGSLEESEVQSLYARAAAVIFPSFYEGFGLPIVNALAYGRTVLARESTLLDELEALCKAPGRLIRFATNGELVERLSRIGSVSDIGNVCLERAHGDAFGWVASARELEAFVSGLVTSQASRWAARVDALDGITLS
jgi:glycosyltransferase involved in cell wall biosynthesis